YTSPVCPAGAPARARPPPAKPTMRPAISATWTARVGSIDSKPRRQPFSQREGSSASSRASGTSPRYETFQVRACMRDASAASSMTPRRISGSGMGIEPVGDAPRVIDAVLRLAAAGELVGVVLVAHEDRFLAEHLQRDEELLGLLDRAAVVLLGVQDEERRL